MSVTRLHAHARDDESFGRARVGRPTMVLLILLRVYAVAAIAITVYAFIRALH